MWNILLWLIVISLLIRFFAWVLNLIAEAFGVVGNGIGWLRKRTPVQLIFLIAGVLIAALLIHYYL